MRDLQFVRIENVKVIPILYWHSQGKSVGYNATYLRNGVPNSARFNHFTTEVAVKAWLEQMNRRLSYQEDTSGI